MFTLNARNDYLHWFTVLLLGVGATNCGSQTTDTGTETHWLTACETDTQCGRLSCVCGFCTTTCDTSSTCPNRAPHCVSTSELECDNGGASAMCWDEPAELNVASSEPGKESAPPAGSSDAGTGGTIPKLDPAQLQCRTDGWCWLSPDAPGERIYALTPDGMFAVGAGGTVFERDAGYHPSPTSSDLTLVSRWGDSLWVGGPDGVWLRTAEGWSMVSDGGVSAMVASSESELWAIRGGDVALFSEGEWTTADLPQPAKDGLMLRDVTALEDGSVLVLGSYQPARDNGEGTLFSWDGTSWTESPAGLATGDVRFLKGGPGVYAYHVPDNGDDTIMRVFDVTNGWEIVADDHGDVGSAVFWGPDGELWFSADGSLFHFNETTPLVSSPDTNCTVVAAPEADEILCSEVRGGLTRISAAEGTLVASIPGPTFPATLPDTFGTQPVPVWAQATTAWAAAADDVWRAPLEHFDGSQWLSHVEPAGTFSATAIDGTSSNDVWFAGGSEVRRWDGASVNTAALADNDMIGQVLALRASAANSVWALVQTDSKPAEIQIQRYNGRSWAVVYRQDAGVATYSRGAIVGTQPTDLWAAFGQTLLRYDGAAWTTVVQLDAGETLLDAAADDADVWVLTDRHVYQVGGTELVDKGPYVAPLDHLAVSMDHLWTFDGVYALQLAR